MTNLRPFISYASADRDVADRVARHLTACGILPIYDIWWLRQMPGSDVPSSFEEIKMGINHSNAFVYFDSTAARQSPFVKYECEWFLWRTCSDAPGLPIVCVLLDDPNSHVPHWFTEIIDWTDNDNPDNFKKIIEILITAIGGASDEGTITPGIRKCRQLASKSEFPQLKVALNDPDISVRCEAAILLATLDNSLDALSVISVVRELELGLNTVEAERVIRALGNLREKAAPAINGIARFAKGPADAHLRARACRLLGRIGACKATISALTDIAAQSTGVQAAAITELGSMGSAAQEAIPALVELCDQRGSHLRLAALTALGKIGQCDHEVLMVLLEALAETESKGIAPSQLHHNAMCILYQLMPNKNDLAMAILSTHKRSRRFKDWFSHEFPEFSEMMNTHTAEEKLHAALIPVAQKILQGTQLYTLMQGADRPY